MPDRIFTLSSGAEGEDRNVVVTIIGRNRRELAAGVSWPASGSLTNGGREGPLEVELALIRAEIIARTYGFARPLIWMEQPNLWNPKWGLLDHVDIDDTANPDIASVVQTIARNRPAKTTTRRPR